MRVQLVFAPPARVSKYEVLAENMWPPLGVLYLASHVRENVPNIDLTVTDGCRLGLERTISAVEAFRPRVLGISFLSTTAAGAFKLAREVKRRLPSTLVVLGGPHATALPLQSLIESGADLVLAGEGERSFSQLVRKMGETESTARIDALRDVDGACYFRDATRTAFCHNTPPRFVEQLDDIPFPAWDLVDLRAYRGWYVARQRPEAAILSARGCPYSCTFCSNGVWKSSGPAWRRRSAVNVVNEIEYLYHTYGIKEIFDQADEFNASPDHAMEICHELRRRRLGITWKAQLRATPLNDKLARAMAEAGCWYVHLGIESGNQQTLDGVGNQITIEDIETACTILQRNRIKVLGLVMLYNAWEVDGELRFEDSVLTGKTLRFADELVRKKLINYLGWSVATPYPGSRLYEIAQRHKLIPESSASDLERWQTDELFPMVLPGVDKREQASLKRKGERLRVKCLLTNRGFRLHDLMFLVKRGFHVLAASRRRNRR